MNNYKIAPSEGFFKSLYLRVKDINKVYEISDVISNALSVFPDRCHQDRDLDSPYYGYRVYFVSKTHLRVYYQVFDSNVLLYRVSFVWERY